MQIFMLNLLKETFKNNHYSTSLLDPEKWWCILANFKTFEQISGTVMDSYIKKKDLKITDILDFICLLIIICTLNAKFQKKCMPAKLLLVQNWDKWPIHFP